ncbi:hypothetical protein JVU11DRAFT_8782 [Chiua virens]|nr:hypothetical protein JVU11DRAFT_8782 [Chiua virens]
MIQKFRPVYSWWLFAFKWFNGMCVKLNGHDGGHMELTLMGNYCIPSLCLATGEAESFDFSGDEVIAREVEGGLGHGKRKHMANTCYSHSFWLSLDD